MSNRGDRNAARSSLNPTIKKQASSSPSSTPEELKDAAVHISLVDLEERVADTRDKWENESLVEGALDVLTKSEIPPSLRMSTSRVYWN